MGIGKNVKRMDALPKVTGSAKYVEDLIPANAFYVKVVHSTIANGRVLSIHTEQAQNMPGVELIMTCFDVPENCFATAGAPVTFAPAEEMVRDRRILTQRVRYYGDDVAAVVADTPLHAQLAAEKIRVEYEEYTPMFTPEAAIGASCVLHEAFPENELARMDFRISEGTNPEYYHGTFSTCEQIGGMDDLPTANYQVSPVHACHLENNCCFAYMEGEKLTVVSCNQVPFSLRRNLSVALGIPLGNIRIVKPYIGGGFGNKQDTMYEPLAALASMRLGGHCIAVVLTREETFINTRTRHGFSMKLAAQFDSSGKMKKRGIRIHSNGGSYATHGHAVAAYAVTNNFQTYVTEGLQIGESSTAYTNLPAAAAVRGFGIPQLAFAMESHMDDIAQANGWDPLELRLRNLQQNGFVDPFDKFTVQSCGISDCVRKGRELTQWDSRRREYDAFNRTSAPLKKGLGMAVFSYKTGVYPIQLENAACRIVMNEDGSAQIQVGAIELGQGSDTVFSQMVSEITTIPESRLTMVSKQDTDISPYDSGAYASRQTYVSGGAVKKAAKLLKYKLLDYAARIYGLSADELDLQNEMIVSKKEEKAICSIAQVCCHMNFINDLKTETTQITAEATYTADNICFAYGASFVDLEVDIPLGRVNIHKIYAIHDSGRILNPQLAAAQIHGGVAMGVGYALGEELCYHPKTGEMLNPNLLDYKFPTSMDIPPMEVHFIETNEPSGPFGNKGLGEPPMIPQAPAIRNAILHATGVGIRRLPMNPQNLVHEFLAAGLIVP